MASFWSAFRATGKRLRDRRIGYAGIWLLFLYALFSTFVVLSFSAFQLQLTIHNYKTANGKAAELWTIKDLYGKWKVDVDALADATSAYNEASSAVRDKTFKSRNFASNLAAIYSDCRVDISDQVAILYKQIEKLNSGYALLLHKSLEQRNLCKAGFGQALIAGYTADISQREVRRKAGLAAPPAGQQPTDSTGMDALLAALNGKDIDAAIDSRLAQAREISNTALFNADGIDKYKDDKQKAWEDIGTIQAQINQLFAAKGGAFDDTIGNYLISFSYFEAAEQMPYIGLFIPDFSKMPPDTLTLILVLAMGALGGTIQLSRKHLLALDDNDAEAQLHTSYYIFRPFLGAITALSVYILFKAGVLIASVPSPGGETANLSPFFISFLGIVSGLLAEQALETIERVGQGFFSNSAPAPVERWAYGLKSALSGDGTGEDTFDANATALSISIGSSKEQVMKWADENELVPDSFQKLIAAYLRLPLRSLFTDIKP